MTKSNFANGLQSLTPEQFDQVTKELLAEAARRGNTSSDWDRLGQMNEHEWAAFQRRLKADEDRYKHAREANAAAAKIGKVLADPKAAETNEGADDNAA